MSWPARRAFLRWRYADLFSAGSCWLGWASMAPLGWAGPLPWGGTAAGLQSAYHDRRTPRHPERQREGKWSRPQSRDKPLSCWENQRPSPPEGEKRSSKHTTTTQWPLLSYWNKTWIRPGCRIRSVNMGELSSEFIQLIIIRILSIQQGRKDLNNENMLGEQHKNINTLKQTEHWRL